MVTKDINLRLKADVLGIPSEDYGQKDTTLDELYSGQSTLEVSPEELREFEAKKFLGLEEANLKGIFPNGYVIIQEKNNERRRNYGRFCKEKGGITSLIPFKEGVWGLYPKNTEQRFALDALLNNDV